MQCEVVPSTRGIHTAMTEDKNMRTKSRHGVTEIDRRAFGSLNRVEVGTRVPELSAQGISLPTLLGINESCR